MKILILAVYSILIAGCSALNTSDKNVELLDNLSLKEKESKEYIKHYNNILTLETALKISVDRNLDLKVKIIEEEIAKLDKRIAFGNFLPKISLGYSYTMLNNKVMGEALDTGIPALPGFPAALEGRLLDKSFSLFNVNTQMPIFVPSTWFLYSARQKGENISVLTRELTEKMIKLQTIGEYYYILALESEREYLSKELASAQELNKNAKVALETESILKWEYEGTEQMVKMKEHALKQNERDLQNAKISLMNNLNLYPFLDIQLQKPSPFTENNISMEEAVYESLKNSDFIKIRDTAVDMNEDAVKIAVTNFLPKIVLTGGYINTSNEALADSDFFMGTLGGFFSIFNGFQNVNEYKKARKNQEIAFIRKEQEIMKVIFETVNAYNVLESSKEERDIASKNYIVNKGRFEQKKAEKEVGAIDNWEYIKALADYEQALSIKEKTEYKYQISLSSLNMLMGKSIFTKGEKIYEK
ncbi:TolC family protein [uncultured Fusobacterium sp.]|uniref:TolC family protein n=1 Tax=uncultured Fusobacterium sp. TaxID=159267 RepID=UPI0025FD332D|nr:TolC family protein [uncultured Fusobacterium sp.]